ncbi:MAG: pyruvoyl-dependent arginine decarboxylase [Bacteroidales bacterium]|nr:pyruvoyl-dependent arginine decarboxylase [Bacteroidales bacterium]
MTNSDNNHRLLLGNRIPYEFFITQGSGESDITIHAGSFHLALCQAGIGMKNIVPYSSVLPAEAKQISMPENMKQGDVMELILAAGNCRKGERITAGMAIAWLYEQDTGVKFGGLVCELSGNYPLEEIEEKLNDSMLEIYHHGYDKYKLGDLQLITETFVPHKQYGTALVALCFNSYIFPVLDKLE